MSSAKELSTCKSMRSHYYRIIKSACVCQRAVTLLPPSREGKRVLEGDLSRDWLEGRGDYLKSEPMRLPFSGSPGSGQELDACLMPPSFTAKSERETERRGESYTCWGKGWRERWLLKEGAQAQLVLDHAAFMPQRTAQNGTARNSTMRHLTQPPQDTQSQQITDDHKTII